MLETVLPKHRRKTPLCPTARPALVKWFCSKVGNSFPSWGWAAGPAKQAVLDGLKATHKVPLKLAHPTFDVYWEVYIFFSINGRVQHRPPMNETVQVGMFLSLTHLPSFPRYLSDSRKSNWILDSFIRTQYVWIHTQRTLNTMQQYVLATRWGAFIVWVTLYRGRGGWACITLR